MSKIKVLQFPIGKSTGGVTHYVLENWRFIDRSQFQFDFATLLLPQEFEPMLINQGCKVHHLTFYAEQNMEQFCDEFNIILDEGYDAIHLHTEYWKNFICEEIAVKRGVPVIAVHAHNSRPNVLQVGTTYEQALEQHYKKRTDFCIELATHFLANSQTAANFLYGPQIPENRIQILNNAIDLDRFAYNEQLRNKYRYDLGLNGKFVIGHIGRFAYQKNHEFLIDIFTRVSKKIANAILMLVGDGDLLEPTKEKVKELGLEKNVMFLGKRDDAAELYQAMDIFVLPSNFGGLDLVLVEAQTSGLMCLVSDVMPIECKITDNLTFLPLELNMWSNTIADLAINGYTRKDSSELIKKKGFSIKEQIKILERIYEGNL